jgi:hypothetical protein
VESAIVLEADVPTFDSLLTESLGLVEADCNAVRKARKLIGIRDGKRNVYRIIGTTGLNQFLETFVLLTDLGFVAQLHGSCEVREQVYDAVFSPGNAIANREFAMKRVVNG